ncbi:MAG: hypothetical protein AAGD35_18595, partial [Actinomycetota bacterium]
MAEVVAADNGAHGAVEPVVVGRRVELRTPTAVSAGEFLAAVEASRDLHRPWGAPPETPGAWPPKPPGTPGRGPPRVGAPAPAERGRVGGGDIQQGG